MWSITFFPECLQQRAVLQRLEIVEVLQTFLRSAFSIRLSTFPCPTAEIVDIVKVFPQQHGSDPIVEQNVVFPVPSECGRGDANRSSGAQNHIMDISQERGTSCQFFGERLLLFLFFAADWQQCVCLLFLKVIRASSSCRKNNR